MVAFFDDEWSAIRLVNQLDTAGAEPTEEDVRRAERSLRELERAAKRAGVQVRGHRRKTYV